MRVGDGVGALDGVRVGVRVGALVGERVGTRVGARVGAADLKWEVKYGIHDAMFTRPMVARRIGTYCTSTTDSNTKIATSNKGNRDELSMF